jgi:hypothetical protein
MIDQEKKGIFVRSYLLSLLCLLPCEKMVGKNHFAEPKQHVLIFIFPLLFW